MNVFKHSAYKKNFLSTSYIPRKFVFGYLTLILIGTFILALPISQNNQYQLKLIDILFTATSAVCVTGLNVVDTTIWSFFGQFVIMCLIQIGGIGIVVILTYFFSFLSHKLRLKQKMIIQHNLNCECPSTFLTIKRIIKHIIIIEIIGAVVLATQFIPIFGLKKGIFFSVFHSISAFCNAGFDLFGNFQSFSLFKNNAVVLYTISFLIIIGGFGFICCENIIAAIKKKTKLSCNSKLVLITTIFLTVGSFLLFTINEYNSVQLKDLNFFDKVNNLLFLAISPRTAGFNTLDLQNLSSATSLLTMILMFIGGAPGSTAGGIKVTTAAVVFLSLISYIKRYKHVKICNRQIKDSIVDTSYVIIILSFLIIFLSLYILLITNPNCDFFSLFYEVFSAYGTVGLTLSLTPQLNFIGKIVIIFLMFIGRVGSLTLGLSLVSKKNTKIIYPEETVMIG